MKPGRSARETFWRAQDGGLAVYAAIVMPALLLLGGGVLDITALYGERERLQQVAQGAALYGARDLSVTGDGRMAIGRSRSWAESEITAWENAPTSTVESSLVDREGGGRGVRVTIDAHRESLFGRILPPGGWRFSVSAVAAPVGSTPLCVLAINDDKSKILNVKDDGLIRAPACMVHSNWDIVIEDDGMIDAAMVSAVRDIDGDVETGATDAPEIEDPFADLDLDPPSCNSNGVVEYSAGIHSLSAGVHCDDIKLSGTAVLRLEPGEHWFVDADFEAKEDARVEGDNVVLIFDRKSKFKFDDRALVRLTGRESGLLSGFVMVATRENTYDFIITSENVESLLGVIYVPNAQLIVEGKAEVARESAWTVIVAQSIQLKGNPTLFVNANYRSSEVPVPDGVGPRGQGPRLIE